MKVTLLLPRLGCPSVGIQRTNLLAPLRCVSCSDPLPSSCSVSPSVILVVDRHKAASLLRGSPRLNFSELFLKPFSEHPEPNLEKKSNTRLVESQTTLLSSTVSF